MEMWMWSWQGYVHTWIVKRLVDIVWLTRVLLWRSSPINWPVFSQWIRANGRLNAWHSRVTFRYCSLGIKSFFTDTIGGSKISRKTSPCSFSFSLHHLHSTLIVNIRFDAGRTPLSAMHSTVRGNVFVIDEINQILLFSGGSKQTHNKNDLHANFSSFQLFIGMCYLTLMIARVRWREWTFFTSKGILLFYICLSVFAQYDQYK